MGQRINIQYTVDVDDLPREVGRLLEKAFNDYQLLQVECRQDDRLTTLSYDMVEKIDRIRLTLAAVDHRLNDASNIISGYLGYKAQQEASTSLPEPVDGLEEKLNKFKEMLETTENEVSD
jgi:hypothetical protein